MAARRAYLALPPLLALLLFTAQSSASEPKAILGSWADNDGNNYVFSHNHVFGFQAKRHVNVVEGVWEYQEGMCWLEPNKRLLGNVMIHIETMECCMNARILGSKLVLSEVWQKGVHALSFDACEHRVLTKLKPQ
jgi:hypothetical protein